MHNPAISYTFRPPCAYCANVVRADVEYSGLYDAEGHAAFTGGAECHASFLVVNADCLPQLGRCRVRDDFSIRPPMSHWVQMHKALG